MPYIESGRRAPAIHFPKSAGELTYAITVLLERYRSEKGDSWQTFSDVYGALRGAGDEFQRLVVEPYEDHKRGLNGPVFSLTTIGVPENEVHPYDVSRAMQRWD